MADRWLETRLSTLYACRGRFHTRPALQTYEGTKVGAGFKPARVYKKTQQTR